MNTENEKAQSVELSTYDTLECPECEKPCKPDYVKKNGTVVYKKHSCVNSDRYYFAIDINGDLIE